MLFVIQIITISFDFTISQAQFISFFKIFHPMFIISYNLTKIFWITRFNASTPGTHFWHGHAGLQRADGLFGHLVVRQSPKREQHYGYYDYDLPEHTIIVNDWWHRSADSSFAQHHHSDGSNKPRSVLINGRLLFKYVCE